MIQVISEKRRPSMGEKFSSAIGTALPQLQQLYDQKQEDKSLEGMGLGHLIGLSPEMKKLGFAESIKGQKSQMAANNKQLEKEQEKEERSTTFNSIVDQMEKLKPYAGTTKVPFTKSFLGQYPYFESSQRRAEINTLRLSLEGLFRDLTLKGQFPKAIYESILKQLPSAEDSEKRYQGKLDAIRGMLEAHYGPAKKQEMSSASTKSKRPPLESFHR